MLRSEACRDAERLANTFAGRAGIAACFQFTLAFGAPWGRIAWGGKFPDRLPVRMRAVEIFSAMLLFTLVVVAQVRGCVIAAPSQSILRKLNWIVVTYCGLGAVANAISPREIGASH